MSSYCDNVSALFSCVVFSSVLLYGPLRRYEHSHQLFFHLTPFQPSLHTEPTGWNDILDQAWRAAVDQATCPTALMECVLLLEHYLNKAWLTVLIFLHCTALHCTALHCTALRCTMLYCSLPPVLSLTLLLFLIYFEIKWTFHMSPVLL